MSELRIGGNVTLTLRGPDGRVKVVRHIHNLMTTLGLEHLADQLATVPDEAAMNYMAIGTGTNPPAVGDTTLQTEIHRHVLTSRNQGAHPNEAKLYFVADFAANHGIGLITEAGILNELAVGILLARVTFTGIDKTDRDTLHIEWKVAFSQPA